jgi:hypothetical protein
MALGDVGQDRNFSGEFRSGCDQWIDTHFNTGGGSVNIYSSGTLLEAYVLARVEANTILQDSTIPKANVCRPLLLLIREWRRVEYSVGRMTYWKVHAPGSSRIRHFSTGAITEMSISYGFTVMPAKAKQ